MNDPYLYDEHVVARLRREYDKHKKLIVAVDFDDTVFPWSDKSEHPQLLTLIRRAQDAGFYIVVFTASTPDRYDFMRTYLLERGIRVDSINQNPVPMPYGNNGKIYYNILLDDRAGLKSAYRNLYNFLDSIGK